ncbi:MAG: RNA methyltransferase [Burkholderiaceae bacterium]|jgi:TrmH family RNA methyltransferase
MKVVASRENPSYKALRLLVEGRGGHKRLAQAFIEGPHLCSAYLERFGAPLQCVLTEAAGSDETLRPLTQRVPDHDQLVLADPLFRSLSQLEQGVGIAFVIAIPQAHAPFLIDQPSLLIDRLQDPGNLGSIMRSGVAAGIKAVYCAKGTVAAWSQKVVRAGMGAHFAIDIVEDTDLAALIASARIPVLATSSHATKSLYEVDLKGPTAWVFGNEGQGVDPTIQQAVTVVRIPQPGGLESLNVAAAAAVCLYEGVRQRA